MWAIRKASIRIKFQPFSSLTFRASKSDASSSRSSYTHNTGFNELELQPHVSVRPLTLKRFHSQNSFIGKHTFSSHAGIKSNGENDVVQGKNESDSELISEYEDEDDDIAFGVPQNDPDLSTNRQGRRAFFGLYKAIINSPSMSVIEAADKWVEERNDINREDIFLAMSKLRRQRMYLKAFQLSVWLEAQEKVEFGERGYASRVNLVAKLFGIQNAENYIEEKIPKSFRGVSVYEPLLANCVLINNTTKAEQVFNKLKELKLPITTFACDQMLFLYKRTDRRKMADVLLMMEKENIKPSLVTYRLLIEVKGQSGDLAGIEEVLEDMKREGLEPDLRFQVILARNYVKLGVLEKAKAVLKEMEGENLNEKRWVCSSLLPIYASLGSIDDVNRVWEVCESDAKLQESLSAIDAFGKLKKVEEAEVVFDKMSTNYNVLSAKHYTAMLKVYGYNKMWTKGKNLVKQMIQSGCGIGPNSLDALVKFYIEAGEIKEVGLILNLNMGRSPRIKGTPFYSTYMMILEEYAKRGDVNNAEMIFDRMRQDGYVLRQRLYSSLLLAYINAKIPAYGFRKRLESDGIIPSKFMEARLDHVNKLMTTY